MYSEEQVEQKLEEVVRKVVPDAVGKNNDMLVNAVVDISDHMKDEIYNYAGENGELNEEGEVVGMSMVAITTVIAFADKVINTLVDSKIKVVTSPEEAEFYKSLGQFELGSEDKDENI